MCISNKLVNKVLIKYVLFNTYCCSLTIVFCIISLSTICFAQQDTLSQNKTFVEVGANVYTTVRVPFWLQSNVYGTAPLASGSTLRIATDQSFYLSKNKNWSSRVAAEAVVNLNANSNGIIPQSFAEIKYKQWSFWAGRRKEIMGIPDSTIGIGSYSWSGNATPLPKIQIQINDYILLTKKLKWFAFKGFYSHGWFGTGKHAYDYWLHQKSAFIRLGNPRSLIHWYGGFTHEVMWGGRTFEDLPTVVNRKMASSFTDYLYMITGRSLKYTRILGPIDSSTVNTFDTENRIGNHIGTLESGLTIRLRKCELRLYRQSIIEDGSLFYLLNVADGLHGITVERISEPKLYRPVISKINLEFLYTMSQGGTIIDFGQVWGRDNYFNHAQYLDGWTYKGRVIGTPFFTNQKDSWKSYKYNGNNAVHNNRVTVLHIATDGYWSKNVKWRAKLSWSRNFGTYDEPYDDVPTQISGYFMASGTMMKGLSWSATTAFDSGQLFDNAFGIQVGIRKTWGK